MRGSEFLSANAGKSLAQWEMAAIALSPDSFVQWPMAPVVVSAPPLAGQASKHTGRYFVASDYLAVGVPEDYIRLPLTPIAAQRIANRGLAPLQAGMLLPTSKMVEDIWRAGQKLMPQPLVPNKGANLAQFAEHSRLIDSQLSQLAAPQGPPSAQEFLVSGQKKDVIISNIWKPGKVVIYGWYRPDGTHIQPKTNVHGDFYVDYSHGIRLVAPTMEVDGQPMAVEDVLKSKELSSLLSDEGPIAHVRYPAFGGVNPGGASPGGGGGAIAAVSHGFGYYYKLGATTLLALATHPGSRRG